MPHRHEELRLQAQYRLLEKLHTSEQRYKVLIEGLGEAVFQTDADGCFIFLNPAWSQMSGYSIEESLNLPLSRFVHPDDRDTLFEKCREEIRLMRKDGGLRWVEVSTSNLRDSTGQVMGITGALHDVSARKRFEEALQIREKRWSIALEGCNESVWDWNVKTGEMHFSPYWKLMLGYNPEELDNSFKEFEMRLHPDDRNHVLERLQSHVRGENMEFRDEFRLRCKGGNYRWIMGSGKAVTRDSRGSALRIVGIHADITERRKSEEKLNLFASAFEKSAQGVMITDKRLRIIAVNPSFTTVTGYTAAEALGQKPNILKSGRQGPEFYKVMWDHIRQTGHWQGEIWNRRKNGELYCEWLVITAATDSEGGVTHYTGVFSDINERKQAETLIQYLAQHDSLTGLPNRVLLCDRIEQALLHAVCHKNMIAVLFVGLDRFKVINDTLGHEVGDAVISQMAGRLKECLRKEDTIARLGGALFVLVLNDIVQPEEAGALAKDVRDCLSQSFKVNEEDIPASACVGISLYPVDGADVQSLMKNAGTALHHGKETGFGIVRFYSEQMNLDLTERFEIERNLRQAIGQEEFFLAFQPQIDISSGKTVAVEVLLRWSSSSGLISPSKFIPIAEKTGFIHTLGEWVLRKACMTLAEWDRIGLSQLKLAVNISELQFRGPKFLERVQQIIEETKADPTKLELEITESSLIDDLEVALYKMQLLHALGIGLAIDDFGTGFSSFSYLSQLPVHALKIDMSFIRHVTENPKDAEIVRAIISMAHNLHLKTVAEGVETQDQLDFLSEQGCDLAQGYYIGKPMSVDKLMKSFSQF